MSLIQRATRRAVHAQMERLAEGRLTLRDAAGTHVFGSAGSLSATVTVHDPNFYSALALGGHVGATDSYIDGEWDADDLVSLVRILLRNRDVLDDFERGLARLVQPGRAFLHALKRNTRKGSRDNILAHYDLGNEFFEQFLDDTMTYSCGVFETPRSSMRDASIAKYDRICRKLDLTAADHVLEIGTGWGGFALHAATTYGCRVTTTTISDEQFAGASRRIADAGLSDRVRVLKRDYRDLAGTYDKLVSIEMIEAVGHQYYDTYFDQCARLLAPHGVAAIQSITIQDRYYDSARREVDFIKRYIFPGGCIPAISVLTAAAARTDLRLVHLEDLTPHYAETLRRWRRRFRENWDSIQALGFDDRFRRLWELYFMYCEGGFTEAVLGDLQFAFAKPRAAGVAIRSTEVAQAAVA